MRIFDLAQSRIFSPEKLRKNNLAEALVRLTRLRVACPPLALGVSGINLESRVRELLTPRPRSERPGAVLVTVLAVGVWACALLGADQVHSVAEVLFRAIGS